MSLSEQVDEFTKSIQHICQSKETIIFDSVAQKLSDEVNEKFKSWKGKPSMIWKSIRKFHSEHSKFKLKNLQFQIMKEVKENHPYKTNSEVDQIVKNLLKDGGFYSKHSKDRDQYLSEKAEHTVDEAISLIMLGHPGLLIRGLKCEGQTVKKKGGTEIIGTFSHLKPFLGDIAPNCKGECGGIHQNECYNFEADIILLYPSPDGKLNIVLIEVKRSTDPNKLSESLITEALVQLKKDTHFILQLLQDIPSKNLKINTFLAFPEAEDDVVEELFTVHQIANSPQRGHWNSVLCSCLHLNTYQIATTYFDNILTKTDLTSSKGFRDKLKLDFFQSKNEREITENIHFLSACARLRGHQNLTVSNKEQKEWMLKYEEDIEKQLIMFDENQREILNNLESKPDIKHFAFRGGSGTGKTIVALKCIELLIRRYVNQGHGEIFVYALTCQEEPDRGDMLPLVQDFRDNISSFRRIESKLWNHCSTEERISLSRFSNPEHRNKHGWSDDQEPMIRVRVPTKTKCSSNGGRIRRKYHYFSLSDYKMILADRLGIDQGFDLRFRCETMNELVYDFKNMPIENLDQRIWQLDTWNPDRPADLVDTLQSLVESLKFIHHGTPIILFLDEIYETESHNLLGFDFSKFGLDSLLNIIMVFNPILQTHHSNAELDVPIHEPSNAGVITKTFLKRYRNSEKIQKLTKFVGDKLDIYLKTNEENASCVPGKYPVWIDLGFKSTDMQLNLEKALKTVLEMMEGNDIRLLYDGHFEEEVRSYLIKKPLKHFKEGVKDGPTGQGSSSF